MKRTGQDDTAMHGIDTCLSLSIPEKFPIGKGKLVWYLKDG